VPLRFQLEVLGEVQVDRTFMRMSDAARNLSPMFDKLVKELQDIEKLQFDSEGGYGSGGWQGLAESTIETKKRKGLESEILRATNALMESLTGGSGSIIEVTDEWLRFGTSLNYAGIHQAGSPKTNLPQRRVMQLPEGERRNIAKIVQRYILTGELP
jgi:phage gpG-like protein